MADNVAITAGSGTAIAADDIASVWYQRVKLALGADGSATDALGGAGAVAAGVQRVTLASDDPLVTLITTQNTYLDGLETKMDTLISNAGSATPAGTNNIGDVDVLTLPALTTGTNHIGTVTPEGTEYETVAASQTAQTLGATGATGDYISGILVIPGTTSPGNVLLLDNATSITVFVGGASSVSNLVPFMIPLGIKSVSGAWKITTGANVTCIGMGNFT